MKAKIYMEVGWQGRFISQLASREPDNFFIAVEGHKSVLLRAMEKCMKLGLTNVVFIPEFENLRMVLSMATRLNLS